MYIQYIIGKVPKLLCAFSPLYEPLVNVPSKSEIHCNKMYMINNPFNLTKESLMVVFWKQTNLHFACTTFKKGFQLLTQANWIPDKNICIFHFLHLEVKGTCPRSLVSYSTWRWYLLSATISC